jgi:hypothetical protein
MKQILPPLLALFSLSCFPAMAVEKPNILLIFTDGKQVSLRPNRSVIRELPHFVGDSEGVAKIAVD